MEEPDIELANRMLEHIIPAYETHHHISVGKEEQREAVRLSKRYLKERCLPDAAIDLVDRAMAVVRLMQDTSGKDIGELRNTFESLSENEQKLSEEDLLKELHWFHTRLKEKVSPVLLIKLENQADISKIVCPWLISPPIST